LYISSHFFTFFNNKYLKYLKIIIYKNNACEKSYELEDIDWPPICTKINRVFPKKPDKGGMPPRDSRHKAKEGDLTRIREPPEAGAEGRS
jgi:hypothetical protein